MKIYEPYFNQEGHQYTTPEGMELQSVTSICKSGLGIYQYKRVSPAAIKGTHIHSACELYDKKDLAEETLDPIIKPYLDQYKIAMSECGITIIQNEVKRYHPEYMYAGSVDKIAKLNGEYILIDIKTGKIEPWHMIQLGAYKKMMLNEIPELKRTYALYLSDTGYELKEYEADRGFSYFLALLASVKIKNELGYK